MTEYAKVVMPFVFFLAGYGLRALIEHVLEVRDRDDDNY